MARRMLGDLLDLLDVNWLGTWKASKACKSLSRVECKRSTFKLDIKQRTSAEIRWVKRSTTTSMADVS